VVTGFFPPGGAVDCFTELIVSIFLWGSFSLGW
jgi:hypothetical protein